MVEKVFRPLVKTATCRFLALNHRLNAQPVRRGGGHQSPFSNSCGGGADTANPTPNPCRGRPNLNFQCWKLAHRHFHKGTKNLFYHLTLLVINFPTELNFPRSILYQFFFYANPIHISIYEFLSYSGVANYFLKGKGI